MHDDEMVEMTEYVEIVAVLDNGEQNVFSSPLVLAIKDNDSKSSRLTCRSLRYFLANKYLIGASVDSC